MERNKKQSETFLASVLPILLFIRTFVDGKFNFTFGSFSATQLFGLAIFTGTLYHFLSKFKNGSAFLLLVSVILAISCLSAIDRWGSRGQDELIRTVGIFGIYLTCAHSRNDKSMARFYKSLKVASASCGLFAVFQIVTHSGGIFVSGGWRYAGLMYSPNTAAILYSSYLMAEYTLFKKIDSRFRVISISLSVIGIAITVSLGGFIFLGIGMLTLMAIKSDTGKFQRVILTLITSSAFILITYLFLPSFRAKINNSLLPVYSQNADARSSLQWRFDAWHTFVSYWSQRPIFGQGFGSTRNLNMAGKFLPHDEYLRLLVEVGIAGILFFLIAYLYTMNKIADIYKAHHDLNALYTLVLMFVMLLNAISENTFTYTIPEYILAASIGFTFSIHRKRIINLKLSPPVAKPSENSDFPLRKLEVND